MAFNSVLATFSFFVFLVGVILTYLTIDQQSKLPPRCTSTKVNIGLNTILMLSVMMVILPIVQIWCYWGCKCPQTNLWYKWIVVAILTLLTGAASTVISDLDNVKCKSKSVKTYMVAMVAISVFSIVSIIGLTIWNKTKKTKNSNSTINTPDAGEGNIIGLNGIESSSENSDNSEDSELF